MALILDPGGSNTNTAATAASLARKRKRLAATRQRARMAAYQQARVKEQQRRDRVAARQKAEYEARQIAKQKAAQQARVKEQQRRDRVSAAQKAAYDARQALKQQQRERLAAQQSKQQTNARPGAAFGPVMADKQEQRKPPTGQDVRPTWEIEAQAKAGRTRNLLEIDHALAGVKNQRSMYMTLMRTAPRNAAKFQRLLLGVDALERELLARRQQFLRTHENARYGQYGSTNYLTIDNSLTAHKVEKRIGELTALARSGKPYNAGEMQRLMALYDGWSKQATTEVVLLGRKADEAIKRNDHDGVAKLMAENEGKIREFQRLMGTPDGTSEGSVNKVNQLFNAWSQAHNARVTLMAVTGEPTEAAMWRMRQQDVLFGRYSREGYGDESFVDYLERLDRERRENLREQWQADAEKATRWNETMGAAEGMIMTYGSTRSGLEPSWHAVPDPRHPANEPIVAVGQAMRRHGFTNSDLRNPKRIEELIGLMLEEWDKGEGAQWLQLFRSQQGTMGSPALGSQYRPTGGGDYTNLHLTRRAGYENQLRQIFGMGPKGDLDRVMQSPFGWLLDAIGVPLSFVGSAIRDSARQSGGELVAPRMNWEGFNPVSSTVGLIGDLINGVPLGESLTQWTGNGRPIVEWRWHLDQSPEARARADQAHAAFESSAAEANAGGDLREQMQVYNEYGSMPFSADSDLGTVLFWVAADPLNFIPLNVATYLARGRHALQATQGVNKVARAPAAAWHFLTVNDRTLRSKNVLGKLQKQFDEKGLVGADAQRLVDEVLAGADTAAEADELLEAALRRYGITETSRDFRQIQRLAQQALTQRAVGRGLEVASQFDAAKKVADEALAAKEAARKLARDRRARVKARREAARARTKLDGEKRVEEWRKRRSSKPPEHAPSPAKSKPKPPPVSAPPRAPVVDPSAPLPKLPRKRKPKATEAAPPRSRGSAEPAVVGPLSGQLPPPRSAPKPERDYEALGALTGGSDNRKVNRIEKRLAVQTRLRAGKRSRKYSFDPDGAWKDDPTVVELRARAAGGDLEAAVRLESLSAREGWSRLAAKQDVPPPSKKRPGGAAPSKAERLRQAGVRTAEDEVRVRVLLETLDEVNAAVRRTSRKKKQVLPDLPEPKKVAAKSDAEKAAFREERIARAKQLLKSKDEGERLEGQRILDHYEGLDEGIAIRSADRKKGTPRDALWDQADDLLESEVNLERRRGKLIKEMIENQTGYAYRQFSGNRSIDDIPFKDAVAETKRLATEPWDGKALAHYLAKLNEMAVSPEGLNAVEGFAIAGRMLFEVFHQWRLAKRFPDMANLHDAIISWLPKESLDPALHTDHIMEAMWLVMEARAGLAHALDADVVEGFFRGIAAELGFEPSLLLGQIPAGYWSQDIPLRTGLRRTLAGLDTAFLKSIPPRVQSWLTGPSLAGKSEGFVADRLRHLFEATGDKSMAGAISLVRYVADEFGSLVNAKQIRARLQDLEVWHAVSGVRKTGEIEPWMDDVIQLATQRAAADEIAQMVKDGKEVTEAFARDRVAKWEGGVRASMMKFAKTPFGKPVNGKFVSVPWQVRAAFDDLYWTGKVTHDKAGGHVASYLLRLIDLDPGSVVLTSNVFLKHMRGAGALEEARQLVSLLHDAKINSIRSRVLDGAYLRGTNEGELLTLLGKMPSRADIRAAVKGGKEARELARTVDAPEPIEVGKRQGRAYAHDANLLEDITRVVGGTKSRGVSHSEVATVMQRLIGAEETIEVVAARDEFFAWFRRQKASDRYKVYDDLAERLEPDEKLALKDLLDPSRKAAKGHPHAEAAAAHPSARAEVDEMIQKEADKYNRDHGFPVAERPKVEPEAKAAEPEPPPPSGVGKDAPDPVSEVIAEETVEAVRRAASWADLRAARADLVELRKLRRMFKAGTPEAKDIADRIRVTARALTFMEAVMKTPMKEALRRKRWARKVVAHAGKQIDELVPDGAVAWFVDRPEYARFETVRRLQRWYRTADVQPGDVPAAIRDRIDGAIEHFDEIERIVADAVAQVQGRRSSLLDRRLDLVDDDGTRVAGPLADKDPAVLEAKRKALSDINRRFGTKLNIALYDEMRSALRKVVVQQRETERLAREALGAAATSGTYKENFLNLRSARAKEAGRRMLEWHAKTDLYGYSPDEVVEELTRRWTDSGHLKHGAMKVTPMRQYVWGAMAKHLSGGVDVMDDLGMREVLKANRPPDILTNRGGLFKFLRENGYWNPRTRAQFEAEAKHWSLEEARDWFWQEYRDIPRYLDEDYLRTNGYFKSLDQHRRLTREFGDFDERAMVDRKLRGLDPVEAARELSHGDEARGIRPMRSVESERRYAIETYGSLVADPTTGKFHEDAMPWLWNREEMIENLPAHISARNARETTLIGSREELEALERTMATVIDWMEANGRPLIDKDGVVAVEHINEMAMLVSMRLLQNKDWLSFGVRRGMVSRMVSWIGEFQRALVMTNVAFAGINSVDTLGKVGFYRATHLRTAFKKAGRERALREIVSNSDYGGSSVSQFMFEFGRVNPLKRVLPRHAQTTRFWRDRFDAMVGLYRDTVPHFASYMEDVARLNIARDVFADVWDDVLKETLADAAKKLNRALSPDEIAEAERLAVSKAKLVAKTEVDRLFPSLGRAGHIERTMNEFFPFFSYTIKNKLLWIREFANHPAWLNRFNLAAEQIGEENRRRWEEENPGVAMPPHLQRQIEIPWAKGYFLDLAMFSDATRGLAILSDQPKTWGRAIDEWFNFVNPATQAAIRWVTDGARLTGRWAWQAEMEDGRYTGRWNRVWVPDGEPWSGMPVGPHSVFWPFEIGRMFHELNEGGLDLTEITRLAHRFLFFSDMDHMNQFELLSDTYFALKDAGLDDQARAFFKRHEATLKAFWMENGTRPKDFMVPPWLTADFPNVSSEVLYGKTWYREQTFEFRNRVRLAIGEKVAIQQNFAARIEQAVLDGDFKLASELRRMQRQAILEVYQKYPELAKYEVHSATPAEWAEQQEEWRIDHLTDQFFTLLDNRPVKGENESYAAFQARMDAWQRQRDYYLKTWPQVADRVRGAVESVARAREYQDEVWSEAFGRMSRLTSELIEARANEDYERAEAIYLLKDIDANLLETDVWAHVTPDEFRGGVTPEGGWRVPLGDFGQKVVAGMTPEERADHEERRQYALGMKEVIRLAKASGKFDPAAFVRALRARPDLLEQYFLRNPGKRAEWAENEEYIRQIGRFGRLAAKGKIEKAMDYFDTLPKWVKDRYYEGHPGARRRHAYGDWWGGFHDLMDAGREKKAFDYYYSMPKWVQRMYGKFKPRGDAGGGGSAYADWWGKFHRMMDNGKKEQAFDYYDKMPAWVQRRYFRDNPDKAQEFRQTRAYLNWWGKFHRLMDAGKREQAFDYFEDMPGWVRQRYAKANPGKAREFGEGSRYMSWWNKYHRMHRQGRHDEAFAYFDKMPDWVRERYYAANPGKKREHERQQAYMNWWDKYHGFINSGKNERAQRYLDGMPAWVRRQWEANNPGKAKSSDYRQWWDRYFDLHKAGKKEQAFAYYEKMPKWVKDIYYKANPEAKRKAMQNMEYLSHMEKWTGFFERGDFEGGSRYFEQMPGWVRDRYYAKHPEKRQEHAQNEKYMKFMGQWVELYKAGKQEEAEQFFRDLPQWAQDRYLKKHPEKFMLAEDGAMMAKLQQYFLSDDAHRAEFVAQNPDVAKFVADHDSEAQRIAMITAVYKNLPKDAWIQRTFREMYPEVFGVEEKGARTAEKRWLEADKLGLVEEMQAWVQSLIQSAGIAAAFAQKPPKPMEMERPRRRRKHSNTYSSLDLSRAA